MSKFKVVLSFALICSFLGAEEELEFDEFVISGKKIKAEDKAFVTSGAVSTKSDITGQTQSIDSVVRSVPGTFTQIDQAHGGISVNIRGMTGLGRVNTMIDGVTQTAYGTSSDGSGWHGSIGTSASNAPIDENFLVGVDFERGTFSGGHGSNSLMGSANFRTIGVSDVIRGNANFGFFGRYGYGTNGIGPKYMGTFAGRNYFDDNSGSIGFLYGYSGKKITQNYKTGRGQKIGDIHVPFDEDDDGVPDSVLDSPIDPSRLKQKPKGHLVKAEIVKNEHNATLQYRKHNNTLAGREIDHDTYQLNYSYDPQSPFVNLNILAAFTRGTQKYLDGEMWAYHDVSGIKTKNDSTQFTVSNKSLLEYINGVNHEFEIGLNFLRNDYKHNFPEERVLLPYILTTFYPQGTQDIRSIFLNNKFSNELFEVEANLDYTHANIHGHKRECYDLNEFCPEYEAKQVERNFDLLNYSLKAEAKISDLFSPFVSYSRTNRIPNVQEWFDTHDNWGEGSMNRHIQAERADTYQIGFNSYTQNLLSDNDVFGFKTTLFYSKIKNYIYDRAWIDWDTWHIFLNRLNDNDDATTKGIEIEAKYDAGFAFANLSYSYTKTKRKFGDSEALEYGSAYYGKTQFAELPRHKANLDLGARFFDEDLTIGAVLKYTGKAKRITPVGSLDDDPDTPNALAKMKTADTLPKIPTIVDLYATYNTPIKGLTIKAEVQNLFDKDYMDALYTYNSVDSTQNIGGILDPIFIYNNSARGRTYLINFQYKY